MNIKLLTTALLVSAMPLLYSAGKPEIKDVMKAAMKGDDSLFKKVTGGSAGDADAKKLAACLKNLDGKKPPKGDQAAFQTKVAALIKAADEVAGGNKSSLAALKEAGNCKSCHNEFKGK